MFLCAVITCHLTSVSSIAFWPWATQKASSSTYYAILRLIASQCYKTYQLKCDKVSFPTDFVKVWLLTSVGSLRGIVSGRSPWRLSVWLDWLDSHRAQRHSHKKAKIKKGQTRVNIMCTGFGSFKNLICARFWKTTYSLPLSDLSVFRK